MDNQNNQNPNFEVKPELSDKAAWHKLVDDRVKQAETGENQNPFAVIFTDIDHFKDINDTLGHVTGDEVIESIKALVQEVGTSFRTNDETVSHRPGDLVSYSETLTPYLDDIKVDVGHIGGDEFAALCETDEIGVQKIRDRLKTVFNNFLEKPENLKLKNLGVGISIGYAVYKPGMDTSALLHKADQSMYENKLEQLPPLTAEQQLILHGLMKQVEEHLGIRLRDVIKYLRKYPDEN